MFKNTFINLTFFVVIVMISLTGCGSNATRTLDNNVAKVYQNIEGSNLNEYIEKEKAVDNSESYIKSNNTTLAKVKEELAMNKDVIPFDGELGGTPFIVMESIKLVGDQWLYCSAEDGHVSADLLIKFVIDKNYIQFKTCAMDYNGEGTKIIE